MGEGAIVPAASDWDVFMESARLTGRKRSRWDWERVAVPRNVAPAIEADPNDPVDEHGWGPPLVGPIDDEEIDEEFNDL